MFDKYLIVDDSLRNIEENGAVTGFRFQARLGYYRGLGLSMIEELDITIDGEKIDRASIRFDEGKGWLTLDEMETAFDRRWGFGAIADIAVDRTGGLPAGTHELALTERLRVSYLPFPAMNSDVKSLDLR